MKDPFSPLEKEKRAGNRLKIVIAFLLLIIAAQYKDNHWFAFSSSARILYDVKQGNLHYVKFSYIDTVECDSLDDRKYHLLTDSIIAKY